MRQRDTNRHKAFTRRALLLGGGKLALMSTLVGRMYYLQVVEADQYAMLADENRINIRLLPPPRGRIFDRFGNEVASNRQNYQVVLIPEQTNGVEHTLDKLAQLVPVSETDYARVLRDVKRKRSFVPIPVVEHLTWDEFARVNANIPDLPGVQLEVGETRDYPYGESLAHIVGYVGAVSEKELTDDPLLELPGFRIGKSGVERIYDLDLRGKAGNSRVEVNAYGRVIRELTRKDGQPGDDIALTIDVGLQEFVTERVKDESAAVTVLDIHTGDVLAMASTPAFDPNAFNVGLSHAYWNELNTNKMKPLISKTIAGQYPPGSTFKMVVALAAMEAGVAGPDYTVTCNGRVRVGNHTFHCWKRGGHGKVDMVEAIQKSCDIFFYEIARKTGINRIAAMAERFGLGAPTGIDLPNERPGLVPTKEWKQALRGSPWQQGDTVNVGIGQGYILLTPLQMAVMAARIANGGFAVKPRLTRPADGTAPPAESMKLSSAALKVVRRGMTNVVNHRRGTAYRARIEDEAMAMAGKTGSVQVRRISKAERRTRVLKNEEKPWEERDHAMFVAYAPLDAPRYAISVVVEHGGGGSKAAAPVARDILIETQKRDPARKSPVQTSFRKNEENGEG
jgi:penicillin-binding protein 2